MIIRAYKVELDPTVKQKRLLEQWGGMRRFEYNWAVGEFESRRKAAHSAYKAKQEAEAQTPPAPKPKLTPAEREVKKLEAQQQKEALAQKRAEMKAAGVNPRGGRKKERPP